MMESIRAKFDRMALTPIATMTIGSLGYTPPWALFWGDNGDICINEHYSIISEELGTSTLLIKRTASGVIAYSHTFDESKISGTRYHYLPNCVGLPVEVK